MIRATIKLSISSQYLEIPLGASAPEISKRKHDALWQWGAVGEYLVATSLHRALGHNAVILNDHKVPGRQANIDHLVVAPSGVWVFDAKKRSGLIEYKNVGGALPKRPEALRGWRLGKHSYVAHPHQTPI